jgi:hypothetical protein
MESSLPRKARQARSRRRLIAAFLIYGTMVASLLGFFAVFPDAITHETQAEATPAVAATKPGRYEAIIANWNRYRAKDARAEAR